MNDYRHIQLQEIEKTIEETKHLLSDPSMAELAQQEIADLEAQKQALEESLRVSTEKQQDNFDERNIILEVKGAAGGDEAKIWAEELLRMYTRSAQKKGLRAELLEEGIIKISGYNAFGSFKYEAGVHRVQRVPETEKR